MDDRRPLGLLQDPENPELLEALARLELYPFGDVNRYVEVRFGWVEGKPRRVELAAKRWLSLELLDNGHDHVPDADVDQLWHAMVLHTEWYATFCEAVFGYFLHHWPMVGRTPNPLAAERTDGGLGYLYNEPSKLAERNNCGVGPSRGGPRPKQLPSAYFSYSLQVAVDGGRLIDQDEASAP